MRRVRAQCNRKNICFPNTDTASPTGSAALPNEVVKLDELFGLVTIRKRSIPGLDWDPKIWCAPQPLYEKIALRLVPSLRRFG